MFDFVYRFNRQGICVYDGSTDNIRQTLDAEKAKRWWNVVKDDVEEFRITIYNKTYVQLLPITRVMVGRNVTNEFKYFLADLAENKRIGSDLLIKNWIKILENYDLYEHQGIVKFMKRDLSGSGNIDPGIWNMKQFLYGFHRFTPLRDNSGNPISIEEHYYPGHPKADHQGIEYTYRGETMHTPMYGVYTPHFMSSILGGLYKLPSGKMLAGRQREFMFNMSRLNILLHSRGAGKTLLLFLIQALVALAEQIDPKYKLHGILVNYWTITDDAIEDVIMYIQNIIDIHNQWYLEWKKSEKTMYVWDHKYKQGRDGSMKREKVCIARVRFRTSGSKGGGRGGRPIAHILDEADRLDPNLWKSVYGNYVSDGTLVFLLTTINRDTDASSWVYPIATKSLFDMLSYEPMEDVVVRLWHKYGFDQWESPEDINLDSVASAREELLQLRPICSMAFTIDDIEHITKEQKEKRIRDAKKQGMDDEDVLAEFYSVVNTSKKILNTAGLLVPTIPNSFDVVSVGYDPGGLADDAGFCAVGVAEGIVYIIRSMNLIPEYEAQIKQVVREKNSYKSKVNRSSGSAGVVLATDITSNPRDVESFAMRGLHIETPIYYTAHSEESWSTGAVRKLHVPKETLVKEGQRLLNSGRVRIYSAIDVEGGLIEQCDNFGKKGSRYEALKGSDDQVNAMLLALYQLNSVLGYKEVFAKEEATVYEVKKETPSEEFDRLKRQKRNKPLSNGAIITF